MWFFGNRKVAVKLYQQNLELAVKNKTLSLLEKLYNTSTQTLTPEEMARAITGLAQKDLNLEFAAIYRFEKNKDLLSILSFSGSERFLRTIYNLNLSLKDLAIKNVSQNSVFAALSSDNLGNFIINDVASVWKDSIPEENVLAIKNKSHTKTILINPLLVGGKTLGTLFLGFNRDYQTLSKFEKDSIKSITDPVALLLYKAYLYKSIKKAYITEKRAKEELEKLDKIKDQFLLTTQHDLRKPLTSVKWFLDILLNGSLGKQNKKTLEGAKKVQESVTDSIEQVNSFLDIAQFQMGKSGVSLQAKVELLPILENIFNRLKPQAEEKGIYLKFDREEGKALIEADSVKLKAALYNIVDNAVKYTTKGGVTMKISNQTQISNSRNSKPAVLIEVKDTGIGIPKDKINTLFENLFERTEIAKRTTTMGKGIGLYLSAQIIKAHKGRIWAESEGEGKGSTFYIELPLS